jgi:hypothetical protein
MTRATKPRENLTGDPYYTDGYRVVLVLEQGPIALDQIKALDWESLGTFHMGSSNE